jgi:hypothetical protein
LDPNGSRMLDSIKATLTRVLGPESAQVVGFYVDQHLALQDPEAFEKALTDFLGSQAGRLLLEAIKSDLRTENDQSGMPEPVSRFLSHSAASRPVQSIPTLSTESPTGGRTPKLTRAHLQDFVRTAKLAMETGITFKELVTEGLVAGQGATCGYATLACLGRKALEDPNAFAEKVASVFSFDGETILNGLTLFCETRAKVRQVTAQ